MSYKPGQTVSFRLPGDTPQPVINYLNETKEKQGRGFSSLIASIFIQGVLDELSQSAKVVLPLPGTLTQHQKEWIRNPLSQNVLGQIMYQLITEQNNPFILDEEKEKYTPSTPSSFEISSYHQRLANANFFEDDEED